MADAGPTTAEVDWKARFFAEAPNEWKKLDAAVSRSHGFFDETRVTTPPPSPHHLSPPHENELRIEYFQNDRVTGHKAILSGIPDGGGRDVVCYNKDYNFRLLKDGPASQFRIDDFERKPPLSGMDANVLWRDLRVAEDLPGARLSDLLVGKGGNLKSIRFVEMDGKPRLRLDFDRKYPDAKALYPAWAAVDPAQHWAVIAYEQRNPWGLVRGTVEYQGDITDFAFPQQFNEKEILLDGRVSSDLTVEFSAPETCDAPEADFTLQSFGLVPPRP
jgi:hypothetical protein